MRDYTHNDAMVISCKIAGFVVHDVMVDNAVSYTHLTLPTKLEV